MGSDGAELLLLVQMNVDEAHERTFNDWYHSHVPHLLEVPGYRWGRRYVGIFGPVRYLALYEIADRSWLPALLGPDAEGRPPMVNEEFARFEALEGLRDVRIRAYEQLSGPRFTPLLQVPGYRSGLRFRSVDDPAVAHHGDRFRYLALYEIEDEASAPAISDPERMSQEARDEFARFQSKGLPMVSGDLSWNIYRP